MLFWYKACWRVSRIGTGLGNGRKEAINTIKTMTEFIVKRTGKLLFPHLARDQRKHQMFIVFLVLMTSLFATCSLVMWMTSGRH